MGNSVTKDIQQLSGYVYHNGKVHLPKGWQTVQKTQNLGNGFYAEAFYRNGEIVIIYRGTDTSRGKKEWSKDFLNDTVMALNFSPTQKKNAYDFYKNVSNKYAGLKFYAGGHSLGGSLAQMVGSTVKGLKTYTYNAYGTGGIIGFNPKYPENVTNYGNEKDLVFTRRLDDHVGKTFVIKNSANRSHMEIYHGVENMGDIGEAVEYKSKKASYTPANPGSMLLRPAKRLEARLQMEWAQSAAKKQEARSKFEETKSFKRYVNKVSKNERIYTEEEIERFSRQENARHHSAIEYQRKEIGIPTKSQAQRAVSKGGMVYVSAYVRGDGVQVGSYYRSRPHG